MNESMGPDEIELGDDMIDVERRERAGVVVSVRLSAEEADQLQSIAEDRKTTLSRVAREAIATYLVNDHRRADASIAGPSRVTNRGLLRV